MRKTLAVVVTTFALGALAAPSLAVADCMGHQSASTTTEVASAQQTSKPVQQTQAPTVQAK